MSCFDTAIHNLAKDIDNGSLTTDQLAHTAYCISLAYGPKVQDIVDVATSLALTWAWDKADIPPSIRLH